MITSAKQIPAISYNEVEESNKLNLYNETVQLISKVGGSLSDSNEAVALRYDVKCKPDINLPNMHINDQSFPINNMSHLETMSASQWNSNYTNSLFEDGFSLDEFVFGQQNNIEHWPKVYDQQESHYTEMSSTSSASSPENTQQCNMLSENHEQLFDTRNQNFLDLISVNESETTKNDSENERRRDYSVSSDSGVGSSILWATSPSSSEEVVHANVSPNTQAVIYEIAPITLVQNTSINESRHYSHASNVEEEDADEINTSSSPVSTEKMSKKTAYNEKWGVKVLKAWCNENKVSTKFEKLTPDELNNLLCRFWAEVRKSNGDYYGRNSLFNLRAMINKHLKGSPYHVKYDIVTDDRFRTSNERLEKQLKVLKGIGKTITHKQPISIADLRLMYDSNVLGMHSPLALLRKVWFEITLHFGHKGSESQEKLMNTTFGIYRDSSNRSYVARTKKTCTESEEIRMYETGGELCPVQSYKKYLTKLHPLQPRLFQQPRRKSTPNSPMWYGKAPIGEKALQQMMANISVAAKLSKRYTNHCVRTTALEQFCDSRKKGKSKTDNSNQYYNQQRSVASSMPVQRIPSYQPTPVYDHHQYQTNEIVIPSQTQIQQADVSLAPIPSPVRTANVDMYYGKRPSSEMYYPNESGYYECQNAAKRSRYDHQPQQHHYDSYILNHDSAATVYAYDQNNRIKTESSNLNPSNFLSETVIVGHSTEPQAMMYPQQ